MSVTKICTFFLHGLCKIFGHTWQETGFNDFLSEYMRLCTRCGEINTYWKEESGDK